MSAQGSQNGWVLVGTRIQSNRATALILVLQAMAANMPARSSKNQWEAFLAQLVKEGDHYQITPRSAFAALREKFGRAPAACLA